MKLQISINLLLKLNLENYKKYNFTIKSVITMLVNISQTIK